MNIKNMIVTILFFSITLGACAAWSMGQRHRSFQDRQVTYTCPMHHQIKQDHPGNCPICGMTLVKMDSKATNEGRTCSCCNIKKQSLK